MNLPPPSNPNGTPLNKEDIKGSEIYVEQTVSWHEVFGHIALNTSDDLRDKIKENLMRQMVEHMFNNNYIEFTSQENTKSGEVTYRARAYLVPDDQVRILRTTGFIK